MKAKKDGKPIGYSLDSSLSDEIPSAKLCLSGEPLPMPPSIPTPVEMQGGSRHITNSIPQSNNIHLNHYQQPQHQLHAAYLSYQHEYQQRHLYQSQDHFHQQEMHTYGQSQTKFGLSTGS